MSPFNRVWLNSLMPNCLCRDTVWDWDHRYGKRETILNATLSPPEWLCIGWHWWEPLVVLLTVKVKSQLDTFRQCPQMTIFVEETWAKAEWNLGPSAYQPNVFSATPDWLNLMHNYSFSAAFFPPSPSSSQLQSHVIKMRPHNFNYDLPVSVPFYLKC